MSYVCVLDWSDLKKGMNAAALLFGLVVIVVGLIGMGGAFSAPFFQGGPLSRPRDGSQYKPSSRDRWFMFVFCLGFVAYGVWTAIGAALHK
jgi:hypothetical protein